MAFLKSLQRLKDWFQLWAARPQTEILLQQVQLCFLQPAARHLTKRTTNQNIPCAVNTRVNGISQKGEEENGGGAVSTIISTSCFTATASVSTQHYDMHF